LARFNLMAPIKRPLSRKNTSPSQIHFFFLKGKLALQCP
jgi:hypothetical protein